MNIQPISGDDIFRWPDGTTCYRSEWERGEYHMMSDDYEVIPVGAPTYAAASGEPQAAAAGPTRPVLHKDAKVWRVGNGLHRTGPAPRCPTSGLCCANWRACWEHGCRE